MAELVPRPIGVRMEDGISGAVGIEQKSDCLGTLRGLGELKVGGLVFQTSIGTRRSR